MQKLARLLACSAVLATVAMSAPGTALANSRQLDDHIKGSVGPDGTWVSKNYDEPAYGDIRFNPVHTMAGGLCMQAYESHSRTPLFREVCGENEQMILAPGEPSSTGFFVKVKKRDNGSSNDFDGWLHY